MSTNAPYRSMHEHSLTRIRDVILKALTAQQGKRAQYDGTEWIEAERQVMYELVNMERVIRALPPVTMAQIERVERWACGHSDYSSKFALYCAELVLDTGPGVP